MATLDSRSVRWNDPAETAGGVLITGKATQWQGSAGLSRTGVEASLRASRWTYDRSDLAAGGSRAYLDHGSATRVYELSATPARSVQSCLVAGASDLYQRQETLGPPSHARDATTSVSRRRCRRPEDSMEHQVAIPQLNPAGSVPGARSRVRARRTARVIAALVFRSGCGLVATGSAQAAASQTASAQARPAPADSAQPAAYHVIPRDVL